MKSHNLRLKKKGAIEMSMQTIIVVVIGITLLTLGLQFVYKTFVGIEDNRRAIDEKVKNDMLALLGESEGSVALTSNSISIKQDGFQDIAVGFKNIGTTDGDFSYKILLESGPVNSVDWMRNEGDLGTLSVGGKLLELLAIDVPSNAIPGTYNFKIELHCTAEDCGNGNKFPLTIRVTA